MQLVKQMYVEFTDFVIFQGERGDPGKKGAPGLIVSIRASFCGEL